MKLSLLTAILLAVPGLAVEEPVPAEPSGADLLAAVVDRLPREDLEVAGDLTVRRHRGVVVKELKFDMQARWGRTPAEVVYTVRDAFGGELERLQVTRRDRAAQYRYTKGAPPVATPLPDLFAPIQGSDISWADLSLSFLWWDGAIRVGMDEVKGRPCYVVEVPAPAVESGAETGRSYGKVRVWVDKELESLLQAEGYDSRGERIRRLWVKSFKKIDDRWMIKDMEVQEYPSAHRTKLRIREVRVEPRS